MYEIIFWPRNHAIPYFALGNRGLYADCRKALAPLTLVTFAAITVVDAVEVDMWQ